MYKSGIHHYNLIHVYNAKSLPPGPLITPSFKEQKSRLQEEKKEQRTKNEGQKTGKI